MVLETNRLCLRRMTLADRPALCAMLQDAEVMYAYAHAFDDAEADEWIARQLGRYEKYGFGLWAVLLKENGALIGQCGITMQDIGTEEVPEVGYLLRKDCWHRGYATEAAAACRDYAFAVLGMDTVYSVIRADNVPSRAVARRNGMRITGTAFRSVMGRMVTHYMYSIKKPGT